MPVDMSVPVEVTLRWKPQPQGTGDLTKTPEERPEIELRKVIVFSLLPKNGDSILYNPNSPLSRALVMGTTWKLCKGPDEEYRPFIVAKPQGARVEVPNSNVFARLFKLGWKVVCYHTMLHNRLTWAAEQADLGGVVPMWEAK